ncbi:hypothetical protein D3H55_21345 [Bacillus salacetis]|uniref:Uncharacterized protein n=1 Tax=Bacillus salacetis TaxID=2315464 RepID=A0A3A1QP57_9BACI|nr:hypothetical protein D3H55_21345 [Bacillus salacetis]
MPHQVTGSHLTKTSGYNDFYRRESSIKNRLFSHIMLLSEKSQVPDIPPEYKGFTLVKERAALFFLSHRGFYDDIPGYYLKFMLNSSKVYENSL